MSAKNTDTKGRLRNVYLGIRLSPEENRVFKTEVAISGCNQQDYIIQCLMNHSVVIYGNPRVFRKLRLKMDQIIKELSRIEKIPAATVAGNDFITQVHEVVMTYEKLQKEESSNTHNDSS